MVQNILLIMDHKNPPSTPANSLAPKLTWIHNSKVAVEFKGSCKK